MKFTTLLLAIYLSAVPAALSLLDTTATAGAAELRRVHRIGTPHSERNATWDGHIDHISWLDEETIAYWANTGVLFCRNIRTNSQLWAVKGVHEVSDWSVSRKKRTLAVLCKAERDSLGGDTVRIFDGADGRTMFSADAKTLARHLEASHAIPTRLALTPDNASLVVCFFSTYFGRNALVLDPTFSKVIAKFDIDAAPKEMTISPDGLRATVVADDAVLCTRTMKTNQEIYFEGNRILTEPKSITAVIDAPFVSHACHDGNQWLIYTVDNSWATGKVCVHDLKTKQTETFDAGNGHIEIDVDFGKQRIALTGTSTDLLVATFDGTVIAHLPKATLQRNTCLEFSPSGKQIAVGSWDHTVAIFSIEE